MAGASLEAHQDRAFLEQLLSAAPVRVSVKDGAKVTAEHSRGGLWTVTAIHESTADLCRR